MENKIKEELKNELEIAVLMAFIREINEIAFIGSSQIWNERYFYFLNAMLDQELLPESGSLKHIVDFTFDHKAEKLKEYLDYLPGLNFPLKKDEEINPLAIQNHGWILMLLDSCIEEYEKMMTQNVYCKLVFKELNCFTMIIKDKYIHIQSNGPKILDFDWTILSVESSNTLDIKNINFKDKQHIAYYIKNYVDFEILSGKETNDIMEMLMY